MMRLNPPAGQAPVPPAGWQPAHGLASGTTGTDPRERVGGSG